MSNLVKVPKLKGGGDADTAAQLLSMFNTAQKATRQIVALGLFAWEIKMTRLKHNEWGPWLAANAPDLCRLDATTKKPKATTALNSHMAFTESVLKKIGFKTIGAYFDEISNSRLPGICQHGNYLLIADKDVPEVIKPIRTKVFDLVDGKTKNALFAEFKQVEEDEEGNQKSKRGQLKGSKGLTKEQRLAAKEREERERIEDCELTCKETAKTILEQCDDRHAGLISDAAFKKFAEALETGHAYCQRLIAQRKGAKA